MDHSYRFLSPSAVTSTHYRILDSGVTLKSDAPEFLQVFDDDYHCFRVPCPHGPPSHCVTVRLADEDPGVEINAHLFSLAGHPHPLVGAYQYVVERLVEAVKDYVLLHAGVVAKKGGAMILAGPSGTGKTTLVLELVRRGFLFFSDEYCPLHGKTGLAHPFPRSAWTDGPADLAGKARVRASKDLVTPQELGFDRNQRALPPRCLVVLETGGTPSPLFKIRMGLRPGGSDAVMESLAKIETVDAARVGADPSEWVVTYPKGRGLTSRVRAVLETKADRIWNVVRVDEAVRDFSGPPALTPISAHEAAFALLTELKQRPAASFRGERRARPGEFFVFLSRLLAGVACYRLRMGPVGATTDLLERLV